MNATLNRITPSLRVTLMVVPLLQMAAAVSASAATAVKAAAAPEELKQLDEITVRGQRAAIAIADLEDDFYKRFNKLNKDDRYDVHCSYVNADPDNPGSRILSRVCMPEFVIDAMAHWAQGRCDERGFTVLDANKDNKVSQGEAAADAQLFQQFIDLDKNSDYQLNFLEYTERQEEIPTQCYQPPPPELVLMEGSKDWHVHMTSITNADPRLHRMASYLGGLYFELNAMQMLHTKLEGQILARQRSTGGRGPREQ